MLEPACESDLADLLRDRAAPLSPTGGGTRRLGDAGAEPLVLGAMAGIRLYEPGALTVVAGAGTTLAALQATLAQNRQRLAFEVPDLRALLGRQGQSTLGGITAANASGPRRIQTGACRDHLLGLRFVNGAGAIIKSGGRVMKNVTGLDLAKLLAGSHGTLGVITEVAFKLQAIPETEATLTSPLPLAQGLAALRTALGSPFDVSGAAYANHTALIRLEGLAGSVSYRTQALKSRLGGDWQVETAASADLWRQVRDVTGFAGQPGAVWRLSVRPSDAERVIAALQDVAHDAVFDWGGGLIWLLLPPGLDLRRLIVVPGHATLIRRTPGLGPLPTFPPQAPELTTLTRKLREKFDPRAILNPGMMG